MPKTDLPDSILATPPSIHPSVFVAAGAQIIGDVRISQDASVWYNVVLRGDINFISIGERTNVQDGCIFHLENEQPCVVGHDVTVGHGAILHGCVVEDGALIGMGAIVLSGAKIGKGAVVGAGAVVKENMIVAPGDLVVGVPGKIVRNLGSESYVNNVKWAAKYVALALRHRENIETT